MGQYETSARLPIPLLPTSSVSRQIKEILKKKKTKADFPLKVDELRHLLSHIWHHCVDDTVIQDKLKNNPRWVVTDP